MTFKQITETCLFCLPSQETFGEIFSQGKGEKEIYKSRL